MCCQPNVGMTDRDNIMKYSNGVWFKEVEWSSTSDQVNPKQRLLLNTCIHKQWTKQCEHCRDKIHMKSIRWKSAKALNETWAPRSRIQQVFNGAHSCRYGSCCESQKPKTGESAKWLSCSNQPPCPLRANLAANAPNNQPLNGKTISESRAQCSIQFGFLHVSKYNSDMTSHRRETTI